MSRTRKVSGTTAARTVVAEIISSVPPPDDHLECVEDAFECLSQSAKRNEAEAEKLRQTVAQAREAS